ncbi:MAG: hypothetical protein J2P34_10520, partial [Actinobacteria bacterium]|nr:hypothetical protein [Actinomycetota bacterium]
IVVLGGGGYAVAQFAGGGGAITASTASGSPARSGPAAGPPRHAVGPPGQLRPAIGPEPSSPAAQRPIGAVSSNTNYTRAHLARQVHATLAKYPPGSAQRPAGHRNRTLAHAVTGCVHGITGSRRPRLVDIAHYQGRPAMIIVVTASGTATGHVWVVARDCSATRPHLLTQALLP